MERGHTWNTLPASGFGDTHNLWVISGTDTGGSFLNGPLNSQVPISIGLAPGTTHTFTMFADQHSVTDFTTPFVLNLFFDGDHVNPAISTVAPIDVSAVGPNPAFSAFGGTTSTLAGANVQGSNMLSFVTGMERLELTAFHWSHPDVEQLNRVSTYEAFPGGDHRDDGNDFVSQFTLTVNSIPEPSSFAMCMSLSGLATLRRKRR